jgi:hypothetical protein
VTASRNTTNDRWSELSRSELIALGRGIVSELLQNLGCEVTPPTSRVDGRLHAQTPSGRSVEVFVSTQRLGGYVFWTKRRFEPADDRFAAIVLLADSDEPEVYLVPSTEWRHASPPLTDRPNIGKRSEPEYGISVARSSLPALARYGWDKPAGERYFH